MNIKKQKNKNRKVKSELLPTKEKILFKLFLKV